MPTPNPILEKLIYNGLVEHKADKNEWVITDKALQKNAGDLVRAEEWVRVLYALAVQGNINTNVMQVITDRFNGFEQLKDPAVLVNITDAIQRIQVIEDTLTISEDTQTELEKIGVSL